MNYKLEIINEIAESAMQAGYRAFLAESKEYGFFTDAEGSRVVSFQFDLLSSSFSGNYVTDKPRQTGTGWRIGENYALTQGSFDGMFNSGPPMWAVKDAKWHHATLADHLKRYGCSSRYTEQGV